MSENYVTRPKKWSEEKTIKLMRAFRSRPELWDPQHYFKKSAKPIMWNEIATQLNVTPTNCKDKIVNLMSGFRREKAKILRILTTVGGKWSEDMDYRLECGWYAFKELGFLLYKETERKRILSGQPIDVDTEFTNLKQALLDSWSKKSTPLTDSSGDESHEGIKRNHVIHYTIKTEPNPDWAIKPASICSEDQKEFINDDSLESPEPGPSHSSPVELKRKFIISNNLEEINHFTNFIASKMKNYSETTKNAVQKEICDIIFKADQQYYETISNDSNFTLYDTLDGINESKKSKR